MPTSTSVLHPVHGLDSKMHFLRNLYPIVDDEFNPVLAVPSRFALPARYVVASLTLTLGGAIAISKTWISCLLSAPALLT